jgi:hypothetical protein
LCRSRQPPPGIGDAGGGIVADRLHTTTLADDFEQALDVLDETLAALALLLEAHERRRALSSRTVQRIKRQCTAAAVVARKLRARLVRA